MSSNLARLEHSGTWRAATRSHAEILLETMVDMLPVAIILAGAGMRIFHSNAVAREMLNAADPIFSRRGELTATSSAAAAALAAAARQTAAEPESQLVAFASIPLPYRDGRAAVAHVRPLKLGIAQPERAFGAAMAVFITEMRAHAPPPLDALASLFDLTPSEARVLEKIASGKNRRETAMALGVADSTVKTHLERIYSKTGAPDQVGLCRLVNALSWPARARESGA